MRPLDQRSEPGETDDGAVMIWVALMIVVLLGVGALVIDVGALLVERRELQNGADAAALAVAQDCAEGNCVEEGPGLAKRYAGLNAEDGVSAIGAGTPCGMNAPGLSSCAELAPSGASGATGWVRVNTSTETPNGGNQVSFLLAPLISAITGKTAHRGAVAAWGPPLTAATLPFTFSECYYNRLLEDAGALPTGLTTVYVKSGNANQQPVDDKCAQRSAPGGTVEGGFGWLRVTGSECSVTLAGDTTVTAPSKPGNRAFTSQSGCSYDLIREKTVVLPLYRNVVETGANATYTIAGFVGFEIHGYRLPGSTYGLSCDVPEGVNGNGNNIFCFVGKFVEKVVGDGEFGGTDFGARVVKMVG
jgi:hypothetical protein